MFETPVDIENRTFPQVFVERLEKARETEEENRMNDELKPCPFCGSDDLKTERVNRTVHIGCNDCEALLPTIFNDPQLAHIKWNTRTPTWISVNDRLPEPDKWYFISDGRGTHFAAYMEGLGFLGTDGEDFSSCVTHWMPLPELPEGGE